MLFDRCCAVCGVAGRAVCSGCEARLVAAPVAAGSDRRSAYVLEDRSRQIVAALKYRGERRLAGWVAGRLLPLVPGAADVVTWSPATPERVQLRGYDQARELAMVVGRATGIPVRRLLERDRGDQRQTGLSRAQRQAGPTLAPVGQGPELVVLIDDVITTGATLSTAAEVLASAGVARTVAVTFAATPVRTRVPN